MHKTTLRNGVLFYVATEEKTFAVFGDNGINEKVPENFWNETKDLMLNHFKNEDFGTGLAEAIILAGQQLKAHFPYQKDDKNELEDFAAQYQQMPTFERKASDEKKQDNGQEPQKPTNTVKVAELANTKEARQRSLNESVNKGLQIGLNDRLAFIKICVQSSIFSN